MQEMARRVIPNTLKTATNLRCYDRGSEELRDSDNIINICHNITTFLKREADANCDNQDNRNSMRLRNNSTSNSNRESRDVAPCSKYDGEHQWKDCPDNWWNMKCSNNNAKSSNPARNSTSASNASTQSSNSTGNYEEK